MFIHEQSNWPSFTWDHDKIDILQQDAMRRMGYLAGRMSAIGFDSQLAATVESVTSDVVASSQIEGVRLDTDEVRSSVARKFGFQLQKSKDPTHYVEGIVEMMLDATQNKDRVLTQERLFKWHRQLFPYNTDISVGCYRTDEMSVVSGTFGRERVHYRAPSPERVVNEMDTFLNWMNDPRNVPSILKSAIAHLWFVSVHPFDDGNGRIGRAIADMVLASIDESNMRFYSFSRELLKNRDHYFKVLERTQRGNGNITEWLEWYLKSLLSAFEDSNAMLSQVLRKAVFWNTHSQANISERQRMVLNRYLDGYDAKITAKNWAKLADVSKDTALRDINSLVGQNILRPTPGRVRDIPYSICYLSDSGSNLSCLSDIKIETEGDSHIITATYKDSSTVRDKVSDIDVKRLCDGEISIEDLAYKHFAYLLNP